LGLTGVLGRFWLSSATQTVEGNTMNSSILTELEAAIQHLIQHNTELKTELAKLQEQHENLQLDAMEKDEQQQAITHRLEALLKLTSDNTANAS
jgi:FtsZ-binding cell division protein ZapB